MAKKFALRAHCRQDVCAPSDTWRVFCAVEIPELVRESVVRYISRLQEAVPAGKASWARDANLHLTLKFLGEIPQSRVPAFSKAASLAVAGLLPFSLQLEQTGVFPKRGEPRVLWVGVSDLAGKLGELYKRVENESANAGFEKEKRSFHPHLTVARLRQKQHARELAKAHEQMTFETSEILVNELLVIRSELSSAASKYTVVSRHPITGGGKPVFPTASDLH